MNKEAVYDNQINPLMAQVIAICKEHKIAVLASFALSATTDDDQLYCTTSLLSPEHDPPDKLLECHRLLLRPERSPLMITTRDKDGKVIQSTAVL